VQGFVFALLATRETGKRASQPPGQETHGEDGAERTHERLKQSCVQKKALALPSLRQVGHCSVPAAFAQATPAQNFLVREEEGAVVDIAHCCCIRIARREDDGKRNGGVALVG